MKLKNVSEVFCSFPPPPSPPTKPSCLSTSTPCSPLPLACWLLANQHYLFHPPRWKGEVKPHPALQSLPRGVLCSSFCPLYTLEWALDYNNLAFKLMDDDQSILIKAFSNEWLVGRGALEYENWGLAWVSLLALVKCWSVWYTRNFKWSHWCT